MASDDQMFDSSPGGNALEIIGALLGGGSGRPLGGGLMALGNMFNKRAANALEKAKRPKTLDLFQQHGLISGKDRQYYADLSTPEWQAIEPGFWQDLQKVKSQKQETTYPIETTGPHGNTVYGRTTAQGQETWFPQGVQPYQAPKAAKEPKTLTGEEAELAAQLGIPLDPTKQTPAQASAFNQLKTRLDLQRRPQTNVNVEYPISLADIASPPAGVKTPGAVLMRDKAGNIKVVPSPIGPKIGKAAGEKERKGFKIGGENYDLTSPKGDPNNGIIRRTDPEPYIGRNRPRFLWRVNGKNIDPRTADQATILQARTMLKAKGFTDAEILPPS